MAKEQKEYFGPNSLEELSRLLKDDFASVNTGTGDGSGGGEGSGKDGKDGLTPFIGENDNWWIGETDTGVKAKAEDGKDGDPGKNAYELAVEEDLFKGTLEEWLDSLKGKDGTDGSDGKDGFSPIVEVTEIEGGNRVTITDADGPQTFDVLNGKNATAKPIEGDIPVKPITEADYNALTEDKKNSDTAWLVTDAESSGDILTSGVSEERVREIVDEVINGIDASDFGEVYSEEETKIGFWFGEPLYRSCFKYVLNSTVNKWININPMITGITVRKLDAYYERKDVRGLYKIPYIKADGDLVLSLMYNYVGSSELSAGFNLYNTMNALSGGTLTVIYEYTKTTNNVSSMSSQDVSFEAVANVTTVTGQTI